MAKSVRLKGTFTDYWIEGKANYPDDEEAVAQACEYMLSLCGNPGQETLIGDQLENFSDWANGALEEESADGTNFYDFVLMVIEWYEGRTDKFFGTQEIWKEGWIMIAEQSGYHDARDETGEGTGQEFG
jgi:hypothetical protein